MRNVTISELQRNAKAIVDECSSTGKSTGVTRYGDTPVTIVPTEFYLSLLQRDLAHFEHEMLVQRSVMRGYEDYLAGLAVPLGDILAEEDARRGVRADA